VPLFEYTVALLKCSWEESADAADQYYRSVTRRIPWTFGYSARGV